MVLPKMARKKKKIRIQGKTEVGEEIKAPHYITCTKLRSLSQKKIGQYIFRMAIEITFLSKQKVINLLV